MKFALSSLFSLLFLATTAQITKSEETVVWGLEPRVVTPGVKSANAPSDAIILFDGTSLDNFSHNDGKPVGWKLADGAMTVVAETGEMQSKESAIS